MAAVVMESTRDADGGGVREWLNEVTLVGRVSGAPVSRDLPSGDAVVTLRLVVPRAPHRGSAALRKGVEGALHRRFFRAGGGAASRYEVEARSIRRA